ncbi:MAG: NAD(P)-dependent oxidoreductase [Rhodospirillales bacterium]|nr:NAD(P)-dependent oxidoreductase [Rhodospirillales bacterium]
MKSLWRHEFSESFQGREVLVTGSTGFLGWHLCNALRGLGARVSGISAPLDDRHPPAGINNFAVELCDLSAVRTVLTQVQPEYIFHLAGLVTTNPDKNLILPMLENNLVASVNIFSVASEIGCQRLIHTGTSEEKRTTGDSSAPTSPYAAANRAATDYAMMFAELYELPAIVVRPYLAFGPLQPADKLIPYTIRCLLAGQQPLLNNPDMEFEYLYCDDVVRAFLTAALARDAIGRFMDLQTGEKLTVRQIVRVLEEVISGGARGTEKPIAAEINNPSGLLIDGWRPIWSSRSALAETVEWYCSNQKERGDIAK